MARTHLYQPVLKPDGSLCVYAAVTFLDSATGLPTTTPLYLDATSDNPIPNPTQFSPGIVEVWADDACRLDLRITGDVNFATTLPGVDMAPPPEEMLVKSGGFQITGAAPLPSQAFTKVGASAGWTDYQTIGAHDHDGFGSGSTVVGDAKDPATSPFSPAGMSGGSLSTPISASASGGTAAVAMQWKAAFAGSFKIIRLYCDRTPTGTGGCTVGIASAIGANPGAVTFIQQTTGVTLVKGWNVIVLPATVTVVAGTNYFTVIKSTGQDVFAIDTTGPLLGGSALGVGGSGTGIPVTVTFQHPSGDHNLETVDITYAAGEGFDQTVQMMYAVHIAEGVRRSQYYVGTGLTAPSGSTTSATVNFKLTTSSTFDPAGTVDVIDYYSILFWYNQASPPLALGFYDALPAGIELFRVKYALGSMMKGLVGAIAGQTEPLTSTAATSATAWSTAAVFGAFEVGDASGIVDDGTGSTWVGISAGTSDQAESNTTALGYEAKPRADGMTIMGSASVGQLSGSGLPATHGVVIGVGSFGYQDSVIIRSNFNNTGLSTPLVALPQIFLYLTSMNLGTLYSDTATVGFLTTIGNGVQATTLADRPFYFEQHTKVPGDLQVNGDVRIGATGDLIAFRGQPAGIAKPAAFAHSTNVALQNLLVGLQALGLVVAT